MSDPQTGSKNQTEATAIIRLASELDGETDRALAIVTAAGGMLDLV
jgi:hypothetical protein